MLRLFGAHGRELSVAPFCLGVELGISGSQLQEDSIGGTRP